MNLKQLINEIRVMLVRISIKNKQLYLFVKNHSKLLYLIYKQTVSIVKVYKLKRHYELIHVNFEPI